MTATQISNGHSPGSGHDRNTPRREFSTTSSRKRLNIDNINPHVKEAQYAVRGELAVRAEKYREELSDPSKASKLPFDSVIAANIGNPQQLGQKPITFFRQVTSLLENPDLLEHESVLTSHLKYPSDVIARAKRLLADIQSVGAYSQSQGGTTIRESIAAFIERRDGYPANKDDIVLSNGASGGVNTLMHIICANEKSGVMVPIPQYPLYTATLSLLGAQAVPYYLEEQSSWSTNIGSIKDALKQARSDGVEVRAIVVINPGNPTGASLPYQDIQAVIQLAAEEKLVVVADEVYQTNVFQGDFTSFKKVLRDLQHDSSHGAKYQDVEMVSLHSISKGMVGECGHRGGYFELVGIDPEVQAQIYKFISIQLCPPVIGQCIVEMMVNPPKEGEPSYAQYKREYDATFSSLQDRATALYEAFSTRMEGVQCQSPQGSMYLFPTITIPEKARQKAQQQDKSPDAFYCMRLLEATGVCVVPGSGFGQAPGTMHFRTTFLAPGTEWVERIVKFHQDFMDEFR